MALEFDFVVIGAGSAGCAAAGGLAEANIGTVAILEAGPSDAVPQVKIPFGLLFTMGSGRDWNFKSAPQGDAVGRALKVNRGRMLGGSSSINSMVWFRGRADDFDGWRLPGWSWSEVAPAFDEIEARIEPARLPDPHGLSEAFGRSLGSNGQAPPTPERESAGVFHTNMRNGRRWSAADAFLRPALKTQRLQVVTGANVDRVETVEGKVRHIHLTDGRRITARRGIVLSAGSIGSPAILMRSGLGPVDHLRKLGIEVQADLTGIGQNLHDHPAIGVHHAGPNSGYGLTGSQALAWGLSPLHWLLRRKGRLTSNFVEAGAFFRAAPVGPDGDARPDVQTHFIPYMMGYQGKAITHGSGYFADICVCRPSSRGALTLASKAPQDAPQIDLGVFSDPTDLDILVAGLKRLRAILASAPFEQMQAPEVFPADTAQTDAEIADYIRARCGTAYHPVGTVRMGGDEAPLTPDLRLRGVDGLWVADASVMPQITSANTNAPSMMIGHRAAAMIVDRFNR
ncbi:MAG: GMC family oxidoreductase N-terminal domain-containing protein [Pseudomonadota bacterium]